MAYQERARLFEISTTAASTAGAFALLQAQPNADEFGAYLLNNDQIDVMISNGEDWEEARITYDLTDNEVSRAHIYRSSNNNNPVDWGAGEKQIRSTYVGLSDLDDTGLALRWALLGRNAIRVGAAHALPAGGSDDVVLLFGSGADFGIYAGSGAPTIAAGKGSLYLRTDGSGTNNRSYINTDGGTTWTAQVSVA